MEEIKNQILEIMKAMGFDEYVANVESHLGTVSRFSIQLKGYHGETTISDNFGIANLLIGEHGNNLSALEHVIKKILQKKMGNHFSFTLDINDYRVKRLEGLKQEVKNAAKEVRLQKRQVMLRPMSPFERRIVHMLLAEYPDITTASLGEEPKRSVIIKPFP